MHCKLYTECIIPIHPPIALCQVCIARIASHCHLTLPRLCQEGLVKYSWTVLNWPKFDQGNAMMHPFLPIINNHKEWQEMKANPLLLHLHADGKNAQHTRKLIYLNLSSFKKARIASHCHFQKSGGHLFYSMFTRWHILQVTNHLTFTHSQWHILPELNNKYKLMIREK